MKIYAYVSIVEVVLKLIIVAFLVYFTFGKLKLYSILMFGVTLIISLSYKIVSSRLYKECRFNLYWNKKMFSEIMSYSGWNLLGVLSGIIKNQGINILLNIFFGPIVNAARGIAYQINSVVNQFVINFFKSIEPQIIKYYAVENKNKMLSLVFQGSKISYFLLLFITLPVLFETEFILTIWLQKIPEYVIIFTRLVILTSLLDSLSYSLTTAALATGKIKMYQIVVGGILLFNLPVSYLLLKVGFGPEITMIIAFGISFIALFIRILMLNKMVGLNILNYLKDVLLKVLFTSFLITLLPSIFYLTMGQGFLRLSIVLFSCFTMGFIFIYFVGLTFNERNYINELFKNKFVLKSVK
jgi:O-antigen/teichoic acid export membrane protein